MTPETVSREASAVAAAMGIKVGNPGETQRVDNNTQKTNANAQNSGANEEQSSQQSENSQGAEVEKKDSPFTINRKDTQTKEVEQRSEQQTEQKQETKKGQNDREKLISEMLGDSTENIRTKLARVQELEEAVKKSPYKSSQGEVFDDLVAKGISADVALRYMTTDKEKLSHKEVMAFAMQQERPGMAMDKIMDVIDQKYKLGKYAEEGNEAPGLTLLEYDVQPHLAQFDGLKEKLLQNGQSREAMASTQKESARIEAWKVPAKQIFESFSKIEVPLPDGSSLQYQVKLSNEERNQLVSEFAEMVKNPAFQADENGIKLATEALKNRYVSLNFNKLAISFMEQGRSMSNEDWMQLVHNPSLSNSTGRKPFDNGGAKDRDNQLVSLIEQAEGRKKKPN